jgi:putative hydrolase of the HAD superfamily
MERKLEGILLDLDETLYSREDGFWRWIELEAGAASAAARLDRRRVAELDRRGRGDKRVLLEYLDSAFGWHQTHDEREARFRNGLSSAVRLEPGVKESLTRIASRFRLGLVSNGTSATQRAKLKALAIEELFDPVVISEEVGFRKPDVRIFALGIANWHVEPASVLFVGDDPVSDIGGAIAAGMRALSVGRDDGIPSILSLESWLADSQP